MASARTWPDFELIYTYTRRQAIADGVLVKLDPEVVRAHRVGHLSPVMTSTAYAAIQADKENHSSLMLTALKLKAEDARNRRERFTGQILFQTFIQGQADGINLKAVWRPDDDGETCLTIMLHGED